MRGFEEKGVIHSVNMQDNRLEVITVFKSGYPDFNIRKDECRQ